MLLSSTHPSWFASCGRDLGALLSDHLHCERKAAENALHLVRRYPGNRSLVESLSRLAHEETSHLVQMAVLLDERGFRLRPDVPNRYARDLLAEVRPGEPARKVDSLLVAALIEARSHERLQMLARGFAAHDEPRLSELYDALASAEDRHAELYVTLAREANDREADARLFELAMLEAQILAALPHGPRIH